MSVQKGTPKPSLTPEERAHLAETQLEEALQQLQYERQRAAALEAKLQELKIPLDFLSGSGISQKAELPAVAKLSDAADTASDRPIQPTATIRSIYTDGACSGNPGPGGWGTVVYFADGSIHEMGGADSQTTNNRMEMQAAIAALQFLTSVQPTEPVTLYTDSEYVKNGITQWIAGWKKKGWKTATGKPVLNQDLWRLLDELNAQVTAHTPVKWQYVKGHAGIEGNERCDAIARSFSLGKPATLQQLDR